MTRPDDLVAGYARVRGGNVRVVAHARGDDRVTRRKRGLGEKKRRVDNINDSFEYDGGIALQRLGGPRIVSGRRRAGGKLPVHLWSPISR